jgi:hypothetical protein
VPGSPSTGFGFVWYTTTAEQKSEFDAGFPFQSIFPGPGQDHVVLVPRDACVVWNLPDNKSAFALKHEGFLSISGEGSRIAVLRDRGRQISVWDIHEGTEQGQINCDRTRFERAVFVEDDRLAVTDDGGLRIEPIRSETVQIAVRRRMNRQLTREEWERFLPTNLIVPGHLADPAS